MALSVASGLALGVLSRVVDDQSSAALSWIGKFGGLWLLTTFGLGAPMPTRLPAGIAGALGLLAALVGYYGFMHFAEGEANSSYLRTVALPWLIPAVLGGFAFGVAGRAWRREREGNRGMAVGLLAAALVGEAVAYLLRSLGLHSANPHDVMIAIVSLVIELLIGLLLPFTMVKGRSRRYALGTLGVASTIIVCSVLAFSALFLGRPPLRQPCQTTSLGKVCNAVRLAISLPQSASEADT